MNILLTGATGFIGQSLLRSLPLDEHRVFALVRKIDNRLDTKITQLTLDTLPKLNEQIDVFINLAGENIASQPWSNGRKKALYESRVTLTNSIRSALQVPPSLVISMSAVGFYGVTRDGIYDENTPPAPGFAHELCNAWESAANAFNSNDTRVVIYRLGVVLGKGGALEKMRLPFKLGAGGPIAGGDQWFAWIHIDDVVKVILTAIDNEAYRGTYNLVAPQTITQAHFAKAYAASLGRPAVLPTPKWLMKLIFGEMSSLLTEGPQIIPKHLVDQGFAFQHKTIEQALDHINW
ncbi:TIGR01777 family oxidoreductase [Marinomonas sp. A79]|uniref:TIGR01777 family oxidoreductase n=1 Tax=Marinomonas vulgaris TaxID=2823372 RepID=A0ABS5HAG7_9GAMM|nr:TIGR01777 family oxidoreductase [Marinomonas vulgaris]MBR7888442.1 TIGR01777 family oxidoreductase [Marinomonas vulgaris]